MKKQTFKKKLLSLRMVLLIWSSMRGGTLVGNRERIQKETGTLEGEQQIENNRLRHSTSPPLPTLNNFKIRCLNLVRFWCLCSRGQHNEYGWALRHHHIVWRLFGDNKHQNLMRLRGLFPACIQTVVSNLLQHCLGSFWRLTLKSHET